jgi:histidinol-phosphate aminotransferase
MGQPPTFITVNYKQIFEECVMELKKEEMTGFSDNSKNIATINYESIRKSPATYFRSEIIRAKGYKPGFQPKQSNAVKLNANENPYPPTPAVIDSLMQMNLEQLRRYPDPLANDFRSVASEIHGINPEKIMCFKGSDEFLSIAMRAFCDKDRPVAYPTPTYPLYGVLAKQYGCESIEVPFAKDFDLPDKLFNSEAALTIVCNPNSPTGSSVPIYRLAQLAEKAAGILLIDEAYVDFTQYNALDMVNHYPNVIVLRSLSKGYSLAGLRFGYAIADEQLIKGLLKLKSSYNVDSVASTIATAAIKDQKHYKSNIQKIISERSALTSQLRKLGFSVNDSFTNFILAQPPFGSAAELTEKLEQQNIYVRHFDVYGLDNKIRISISTPDRNALFLAALKRILRS